MVRPAVREVVAAELGAILRGHPHPGQKYKHGWIPVGGVPAKTFQGRVDGALHEDEAVDAVRIKPPTPRVREALDAYGGESPDSYVAINGGLRTGAPLTPRQQGHVDGLDQAMRESPGAPHDLVVYRQTRGPRTFGGSEDDFYGANPKPLTGMTWKDGGFVSTGAGKKWGADTSGIAMRILVPKGTKALSYTEKVAGGGAAAVAGPSGGLDFDEILLDRGLTFRVVADHGFRRTRWDGTPDVYSGRDIDVEVVSSQ